MGQSFCRRQNKDRRQFRRHCRMPPLISDAEKNYKNFISFNSGRYKAKTHGVKEKMLKLLLKMKKTFYLENFILKIG